MIIERPGGWPTLSLILTPGGCPVLVAFSATGRGFRLPIQPRPATSIRDCWFESFPNEPRIRDIARFCASLHVREQRLRHTHVDLFILPLELKPHRLKPRKIEVR